MEAELSRSSATNKYCQGEHSAGANMGAKMEANHSQMEHFNTGLFSRQSSGKTNTSPIHCKSVLLVRHAHVDQQDNYNSIQSGTLEWERAKLQTLLKYDKPK